MMTILPQRFCHHQPGWNHGYLRAKELLRDHTCIAGDGGLILSSACTLPAAITPENFRAMLETGKTYELGG